MARTRRTVVNLIALSLSVTLSVLLCGSLMIVGNPVGASSGKSSYPVAIVMLQPSDEPREILTIESETKSKESVSKVIAAQPGDSGDKAQGQLFHDLPLSDRADYFPVSMLTERPIVIQDIDPDLPDILRSLEPQSFHVTLMINEYGDIDQVKLASSAALTTDMFVELRRHFEVMRFMPGRLEGRPVRSALRILVQLHP